MDQQATAQPTPSPAPAAHQAAAPASLPIVPEVWPGGFGLFKYSKNAVKRNLLTIIVLFVANIIIAFLLGQLLGNAGRFIGEIINLFVSLALYFTYLASVRGQKLSIGEAFAKCDPLLFVKFVGNVLLVGIISVISFIALIVPFFFIMPRIILSPYFLIDKKLGPVESVKASWEATKGHVGLIYGIILAGLVMALPILTIIGIPVSIYLLLMYVTAPALAYEFITKHPHTDAPAANTATPPPAPNPVS